MVWSGNIEYGDVIIVTYSYSMLLHIPCGHGLNLVKPLALKPSEENIGVKEPCLVVHFVKLVSSC